MGYVRFRQSAIWQRVLPSLQGRLTKALALAGIATIEAANAFIRDVYIPAHNARFVKARVKVQQHHAAPYAIFHRPRCLARYAKREARAAKKKLA
ncbi:MAG: hypothetical protein WBG11_03775 [Methylocella sp.]